MSEEKKPRIRNADLARHAGCSPAYITKLKKPPEDGGKGMPDFETLAEFEAWRMFNAPPRTTLDHSSKISSEGPKNTAEISDTTTLDTKSNAAGARGTSSPANTPTVPQPHGSNIIDVTRFITPGADFDGLMIRQAEGVPQVAHGLYELACQRGNPNEIAAALKNWSAAAEAAAEVRAKFLLLQEKTGAVISLDLVMDVVGTELQAARTAHLKLGERCAIAANPGDPALAKRIIDAAVDAIWRNLFASVETLPADLTARAAAAS